MHDEIMYILKEDLDSAIKYLGDIVTEAQLIFMKIKKPNENQKDISRHCNNILTLANGIKREHLDFNLLLNREMLGIVCERCKDTADVHLYEKDKVRIPMKLSE